MNNPNQPRPEHPSRPLDESELADVNGGSGDNYYCAATSMNYCAQSHNKYVARADCKTAHNCVFYQKEGSGGGIIVG